MQAKASVLHSGLRKAAIAIPDILNKTATVQQRNTSNPLTMRAGIRVFLCLGLLLLIGLMVLSPYADLPPTTLRVWQAAILLIAVVTCWAATIAGTASAMLFQRVRWCGQLFGSGSDAGHEQLRATLPLRC